MSFHSSRSEIELEPRVLSERERNMLAALLDADFPGRTALLEQASGVRARRIDSNGSLGLVPEPHSPSAAVVRRVPVEAELSDADGVGVHVLLHVLDGYLNELEIYREDSGPLERELDPSDFRLIVR